MAVVARALFGVVYVTVWYAHYPSHVEKALWREATIVIIMGPISYSVANNLFTQRTRRIRHEAALYSIAVLYLMSRIYTLVEMGRTLFYLPPTAYAQKSTLRLLVISICKRLLHNRLTC